MDKITAEKVGLSTNSRLQKIAFFLAKYTMYIVFLIIVVIMSFASPVFFQLSNFMNILLQSSYIGIIAIGMTLVILVKEIDLSVGSNLALCSAVGVWLMLFSGLNPIYGMISIVLVGAMVGFINGVATTFLRMPAFIVTLVMMQIARGLTLAISKGRAWYMMPGIFKQAGALDIGPVALSVVIMVLGFAIGQVALSRTIWGQNVYAVGSNPEAANICGINNRRIKIISFTWCGALVGVSSFVLTSRLSSFYPGIGTGFEFDAIAAVVIGGTSLYGGEGSLIGTFIGVLIMGVINNAMNLIGVDPYWVSVVKGAVIFLAVLADSIRKIVERR
jgi:ribose/xylose/arabinose/galactoside ABC-type transport system permease subunit